MAKTAEERGPIGAWLVSERHARGWHSAAIARAALERARVMRVAPSVYAEWEAGSKRPNAEQLEALTRFYGTEPRFPATNDATADMLARLLDEQQMIRAETKRQTDALVGLLEETMRRADAAEQRANAIEAWARRVSGAPPPPDDEDQAEIDRFHKEMEAGVRRQVRQESRTVASGPG